MSQLKEVIKNAAIRSVVAYFDRKLSSGSKPNFQMLDLLMPKERLVRSIVGGLETSMGRTLWEPLAKEIATANGFTVIRGNLEAPSNMPAALSSTLTNIFDARVSANGLYDAATSHEAIRRVCQPYLGSPISHFEKAPRGFGVDVWLEKDGVNYFFDTKTVQPNIGSYSKFLSQILNWYAYFYAKNPDGSAEARIVFPYNPHRGDFWRSTKGGGRPLEAQKEALVENEFWDFISGRDGTFELIKECFREVYIEGTLENQLDIAFERNRAGIDEIVRTDE